MIRSGSGWQVLFIILLSSRMTAAVIIEHIVCPQHAIVIISSSCCYVIFLVFLGHRVWNDDILVKLKHIPLEGIDFLFGWKMRSNHHQSRKFAFRCGWWWYWEATMNAEIKTILEFTSQSVCKLSLTYAPFIQSQPASTHSIHSPKPSQAKPNNQEWIEECCWAVKDWYVRLITILITSYTRIYI